MAKVYLEIYFCIFLKTSIHGWALTFTETVAFMYSQYSSLLYTPFRKPKASVRLVCFPYAGGNASSYIPWKDLLPDSIELTVVQLPGRSIRLAEKPYREMDEMIRALFSALQGLDKKELIFYGHSMGARVAYELCLFLRRYHLKLPVHFIASGSGSPLQEKTKDPIHALPDDEFIDRLQAINGSPEEILNNKEIMQLSMDAIRADFKIIENYQRTPQWPLKSSISVLAGKKDEIEIENLEAWFKLFDKSTGIHWIDGDHFFIDKNRDDVLSFIWNMFSTENTPLLAAE